MLFLQHAKKDTRKPKLRVDIARDLRQNKGQEAEESSFPHLLHKGKEGQCSRSIHPRKKSCD